MISEQLPLCRHSLRVKFDPLLFLMHFTWAVSQAEACGNYHFECFGGELLILALEKGGILSTPQEQLSPEMSKMERLGFFFDGHVLDLTR